MWYVNADSGWVIGDSEDIGADEGVMYAPGDVARVELVKSPWRCWDWRQQLIDAGDLEVLSKPVTSAAAKVPAATGDVQVVGERSWEQKNAEGRKNAIALEPDTPRKRSRRQSELLEERVAKARSKLDPAIDQRVKELLQEAFDEYIRTDDQDELARRKAAARQKAAAEHPQLRGLDKAFDDFTAAAKARETVWDEYRAAKDREIAAEAAVNKELGALEPSTSCVKREPTAAAAALPTGMRPPGMSPDMPRLAPPPGMPPPGMPPLGMPPDAAARHRLVFVIAPRAGQLASCALVVVRVVYDNERSRSCASVSY